jgi:hypothetical protein
MLRAVKAVNFHDSRFYWILEGYLVYWIVTEFIMFIWMSWVRSPNRCWNVSLMVLPIAPVATRMLLS